MCPPLVSSFFETALVLELCQPCFALSAILYTYSNIQQFLKMQHVLMYLCALSDGKNGMDLECYFNINILIIWD